MTLGLGTAAVLVLAWFFYRPPESRIGLAVFGCAAASIGLFSTLAASAFHGLGSLVQAVSSMANSF